MYRNQLSNGTQAIIQNPLAYQGLRLPLGRTLDDNDPFVSPTYPRFCH